MATCFLAYANGANDNFKGVATLFGSGTSSYRNAISWATITAFAGYGCSIFLAEKLLKNFSGKGLVPDAVALSPSFLLAVSVGVGITVLVTCQVTPDLPLTSSAFCLIASRSPADSRRKLFTIKPMRGCPANRISWRSRKSQNSVVKGQASSPVAFAGLKRQCWQ